MVPRPVRAYRSILLTSEKLRTERFISGVLGPLAFGDPISESQATDRSTFCPMPGGRSQAASDAPAPRPFCSDTCSCRLGHPETHNAPKLNNAWWRCTRTENCNPPVPLCRARSGNGSTGRERFTGRQLRLDCAWRCRAQGTPGWETSPPPSGVLLGGLSKYPRAGAVSLTLGAGELG